MATTIQYPPNLAVIPQTNSNVAEGTAARGSPVYCAVTSQDKTIESQMALTDSSGRWNVKFNKLLPVGSYAIHATQMPDRQSQTNPNAVPPEIINTFTVVGS
ncbi:hypothetical protein BOSP111201_00610 [Bordetella sputigena]|uniref:hypothetical protein n=1 Tax=Bordetella sputigena TaxID=1416810 RepID=UPI0039EF609E